MNHASNSTHMLTSVLQVNNVLIKHDFERPIHVKGFDPKGPITKALHNISAALAYNDPPDRGIDYPDFPSGNTYTLYDA